ncbi:MAG: hypothetical protein Q4F95_02785 [Oscillospiraceae bacterium]|nr:hypothetical protein [Oscillospiraceae bacterium]
MISSKNVRRSIGANRQSIPFTASRGTHCKSDYFEISEINASLREKEIKQKIKDAEALKKADHLYAGI